MDLDFISIFAVLIQNLFPCGTPNMEEEPVLVPGQKTGAGGNLVNNSIRSQSPRVKYTRGLNSCAVKRQVTCIQSYCTLFLGSTVFIFFATPP